MKWILATESNLAKLKAGDYLVAYKNNEYKVKYYNPGYKHCFDDDWLGEAEFFAEIEPKVFTGNENFSVKEDEMDALTADDEPKGTSKEDRDKILDELERILHPDYHVPMDVVMERMRTFLTAEDEPKADNTKTEVVSQRETNITAEDDNQIAKRSALEYLNSEPLGQEPNFKRYFDYLDRRE